MSTSRRNYSRWNEHGSSHNTSSPSEVDHDCRPGQVERMARGSAYYYELDPYSEDDEPPKKRGRPKSSDNKKSRPDNEPERYNPFLNAMCSICCKYRGKLFIANCGHGMLCQKCLEHTKSTNSCFTCYKLVIDSVEYREHLN